MTYRQRGDRHKVRAIPYRPASADEQAWLLRHAEKAGRDVVDVLRQAVAEYRAKSSTHVLPRGSVQAADRIRLTVSGSYPADSATLREPVRASSAGEIWRRCDDCGASLFEPAEPHKDGCIYGTRAGEQ